jgi:hypothetical protein
MKEYIIHGTQLTNLIQILKDGYIDNKPSKKNITILKYKPSNQIFTQLVYYNIPNQAEQIPHWFNCAIVLDKSLLKDYPFYATNIGGFVSRFENAKENKNTIVYSDGGLDKMPSLTKLKSRINKYMANRILVNLQFMHSHEILFNKKIPLDTYCVKIMLRITKQEYNKLGRDDSNLEMKKEIDEIIDLAKSKNIPIKFIDYKTTGKNEKPINNFIDSIGSD